MFAAEIGKSLADDNLRTPTGFAAADFSRIRQAKLKGFTIDRVMAVLDKLNQDVRVSVSVMPRKPADQSHLPL